MDLGIVGKWPAAPWTDSAQFKKYHDFSNTHVHTRCIHHLKSGGSSHFIQKDTFVKYFSFNVGQLIHLELREGRIPQFRVNS